MEMQDQDTALSREFIEQQRSRLETLRKQLLVGESRTIANQRALQEEHGVEVQEFEDRAQDNEVYRALNDVDNRRLSHIERALQKIEEGTYGVSDASGKLIAKARLEATPEAVLTVDEERRQETGEQWR
jgi:DnaK suppressor protein